MAVPDTGHKGEFGLIEELFAPLAKGAEGAFGLTDDAALLRPPPGCDLVLTKDAIVEGVHFLASDPPGDIARKALRVNLSDLAAKAADPLGFLLVTAWSADTDEDWMQAFADGLAEDVAYFGVPLLGGDTVATPGPRSFAVTAVGSVPEGSFVSRAGALPGDAVFVSGTIGDAALGLAVSGDGSGLPPVDADDTAYVTARYRLPEPRLGLRDVLQAGARAAIDVSDGLVADLGHVATVSGVGITLAATDVPLSAAAARIVEADPTWLPRLLTGGDDYEIAFTAPEEAAGTIVDMSGFAGIPVTRIGRVADGEGVTVLGADGRVIDLGAAGYQHF